jgi:para-aminobenzoate synthetase/4-amino-4-deoxychorismate lyase
VSHQEFREAIQRIRGHIHDGDVYQINYTFRETHLLPGDPFDHFLRISTGHPVPYAAWVNFGDLQVVSLSPELFLSRSGRLIETRPMKGTAKRGLGWEEDEKARLDLGNDPKNRAENVMIVDLMRNDLGRVCRTGSVEVPSLFDVTRYGTVHQMTSTVTGELRDGIGLVDILRATFPPGSVTGAPKVRATRIIAELETTPRDVYCGLVGVVFPGGDFSFNVAIRTLVCRKKNGSNEARLGLGSGIVMDSDTESEWEECRTKGEFLLSKPVDFRLIETIRLKAPKGYVWLLDHLRRLKHSAEYFGFAYDFGRVFVSLRGELESAPPGDYRARLLLDRQGRITLERRILEQTWPTDGVRVRVSPEPVDERSVWPRHKTTRRDLYDEAGKSLPGSGFDEVVFLNQAGQLAEGSFTSILIRLGGRWFYPPEECGRLPGIWLARTAKRLHVSPRVLTLHDLEEAEAVLIGNSLRMEAPVREIVFPDGHSLYLKTTHE